MTVIDLVNLEFRKLDERAVLPTRQTEFAAGLDLYSIEKVFIEPMSRIAVPTGLSVSIPLGCYGRIAPRSGLALAKGIDVLGGVIDSDYRGEIFCILVNLGDKKVFFDCGERVAQLLIEPILSPVPRWAEALPETQRGEKGFGSTGQ